MFKSGAGGQEGPEGRTDGGAQPLGCPVPIPADLLEKRKFLLILQYLLRSDTFGSYVAVDY